ncbi:DUF4376 domain-containing protein [Pelomonas sp. Root1444]|uniref:DUF4376 domain-containing protein n=1 Tax=Pelomonas sp. Root1444 TaxID=1736464 RepID=UPI0007033806|nr:DUF4376 domain-containing protein [Pelomonas sp. Root1444]KQY83645.1 hypothetical protein ASD35_24280 [Pelomonas sp. Root1444]
MLFHHDTTSDDHIAVTHHRLAGAELARDLSSIVLRLESWPSEAARLDGRAPVTRWQLNVPVAGLPFGDGLQAAVAAAVLASDQFNGATPIPDAADSLDGAQARKWAEVKAERASRERGAFTSGGHSFNVDETRLTGAALDAMAADLAGETYAQPWVLADNSVVVLNAAEQLAAGRACKAYIAALWGISQQLRGQIDTASTVAEVTAIHWPD